MMPTEIVPSPVADGPPRQTRRGRLAGIVTEIFAPAPVATILLFVVAWHSTQSLAKALAWGGIAALFATLVPLLYLIRGVRRQQLTDHHVRLREQRPRVLLVGIVSLLFGLALMVVGNVSDRDDLRMILVSAGADRENGVGTIFRSSIMLCTRPATVGASIRIGSIDRQGVSSRPSALGVETRRRELRSPFLPRRSHT